MTIVSTSMSLGSMLWAERLSRLRLRLETVARQGRLLETGVGVRSGGGGEEASEGQGEGWEEASRAVAIEPLRFLGFVSA